MKDDPKDAQSVDYTIGPLPEGTYLPVKRAAVEPTSAGQVGLVLKSQRQDGGDLETHLFYLSAEMAYFLYRRLHPVLSHLDSTRRRDMESPSN